MGAACCNNDASKGQADMADAAPMATLASATMNEEIVKQPVMEAPSAVAAKEREKQIAPDSSQIEAKKETAVSPPVAEKNAPYEFTIVLKKTPENSRLGLTVDIASSVCMVVDKVNGGLLAEWNQSNPDLEVQPGDKITTVNGQSGDAVELTQVCKENSVLEMKVVRG